jgi:hypothetical protein
MQDNRKDMGLFAVRAIASILCLSAILAHNLPLGLTVGRIEVLYLGILCLLTLLLPTPATRPAPAPAGESADKLTATAANADDHAQAPWTAAHTSLVMLAAYGIAVLVLCSLFLPNPDRITLYLLMIAALPWLRISLKPLAEGGAATMRAYGLLFMLLCAAGIVSRIAFPAWTIDTISLILLALMAVPFLLPRIKSLEITGIGKIEFITEADRAVLNQTTKGSGFSSITADIAKEPFFAFLSYRDVNSKLTLAGLRFAIEIKARERLLAVRMDTKSIESDTEKVYGSLLDQLKVQNLLDPKTVLQISDMFRLIDKLLLTHARTIDPDSYEWLLGKGLAILHELM